MKNLWLKTDKELAAIITETEDKYLISVCEQVMNSEGTDRLFSEAGGEDFQAICDALWSGSEDRPYKIYCDRDENLSHHTEMLDNILTAKDMGELSDIFYSIMDRISEQVCDYPSDVFEDYWKDIWDEITPFTLPSGTVVTELESIRGLMDGLQNHHSSIPCFDESEYVRGLFNATQVHCTATPYFCNGNNTFNLEAPHWEAGDSECKDNIEILNQVLKTNFRVSRPQEWPDVMYLESYLTFMGCVDFAAIYDAWRKDEFAVPNTLTFNGKDWCVFFNSYNGSGSNTNQIPATPETKMRAVFRVDSERRYGVDETYGFIGRVWGDEFLATRETWEPDVMAIRKNRKIKLKK
jgi:hypothetical protein